MSRSTQLASAILNDDGKMDNATKWRCSSGFNLSKQIFKHGYISDSGDIPAKPKLRKVVPGERSNSLINNSGSTFVSSNDATARMSNGIPLQR